MHLRPLLLYIIQALMNIGLLNFLLRIIRQLHSGSLLPERWDKMSISLAIVGTGAIALQHIKAIEWLNQNRGMDIQVIAAMNRSEESNRKANEQLNITNTYTNIDTMIKNETLDGILVLVTAANIYSVVSQLIPYRIPLLIEKPPGLSVLEASRLAELALEYETKVMVGFNRRFYSVVMKANQFIAEQGGLLGMRMDGFERYRHYRENLKVSQEWLDALFFGNTIHCIDLIRHYTGNVINVEVFHNSLSVEPYNHRYTALIVSDRQVPITFQSYWHSLGNWSYELYFSDGKIHFVNLEEAFVYQRGKPTIQLIPDQEDVDVKAGFVSQMAHFIEVVIPTLSYVGEYSIHNAAGTLDLVEKISGKVQ
jgi:predicted dehydrogenase